VSFERKMMKVVGQERERKEELKLIEIVNITLVICILALVSCAPTKVQVYPKETPPEKTIHQEPISERIAQEKTAPVKITPEKTASVETDKVKPPSERPPIEEIPMVEPVQEKTYAETIAEWKSYQDLVKWMESNFSFDEERYKKYEGTLPIPRPSEETFQLKSGIYIDAAFFLKETLYRINPSYNPRIVVLVTRPYGFNHYVCSFETGNKLFIIDYGTPYKEITGVHGPYLSLEEYKIFYERYHPIKKKIEAITYLQ
jgi:hypothetical protein